MTEEATSKRWLTLAGVLSAVAGMIAVVTGLVVAYQVSILPGSGSPTALPGQHAFRSPDGRYEATRVGSGNNLHYQIRQVATNRPVLTTHAEFAQANDVKVGVFSPDSKMFAAAYHYGQAGGYTWIGIWSLESGSLVRAKTRPGWTTDISSDDGWFRA